MSSLISCSANLPTEQSDLTASLFEEEFDEPASPAEPAALEEADLFAEAPVEESLFAESAEEVALFLEDDAAAEAPVAAIAPEPAPLAAGLDEDDDEEDEAALAAAHDDLPAALADAELPAEELLLDAEPDEEITSKLDSFFDFAEPAEKPEAQPEDASVFTDEVALAEPEPAALMAEEAAPAEEPAALSAEESYAAMPAALADAEIPEENLFATEETVDEELTGDLDSFFAAADEAIAPVPPPVFEEEEELAIALEKPASAPQESVISAMEDAADDSGEVIAALAEVEPEEDLFALQTEEPMDLPGDEANTALQEELDNFFDACNGAGTN